MYCKASPTPSPRVWERAMAEGSGTGDSRSPESSGCPSGESSMERACLLAEEEQLSYLPERPEEPLPNDCCGTGCTPCVMDLYREDLEAWQRLNAMNPTERVEWRRSQMARRGSSMDSSSSASRPVALSPVEYRVFSVTNVRQVTRNTFVFTFQLPEGQTLGLEAGQHIVLRVWGASGHSLTRQYTPISPLKQKGSFDVLIKVYEGGRMSRYVRQWKVGGVADWRGPFGNFTYTPNEYERVTMLACGTGIAPMLQIIRRVVENKDDDTFIHLVYGCRSQHDILLKKELDHFVSYWNFTALYALSQTSDQTMMENQGSISYGDRVHLGRIDYNLLTREIPPPKREKNLVLICGTKSFDKDMIKYLLKAGYTRDSYFKF